MRRRGSILATSITLVALMLTMALAAMAYVDSAQRNVFRDRWRDLAEQAARSGLAYVMGWAQASIDQQSQLPQDWAAMSDGMVLDPVTHYQPNVQPLASLQALKGLGAPKNWMGQIVGTKDGEYVLGTYGNYVVTFKARIQQYRVSNSFPRQYRVGVIGRVRQMPGPHAPASWGYLDNDEKDTIVAQSMLLTLVGKEPCSRYAALIDTDLIRNWVPGEVVDGPVHINRGYVDLAACKSQGVAIGNNGSIPGGNVSLQGAFTPKASEVRSVMLLQTAAGGLFNTPPGGAAYPIFKDEVSMTAMQQGESGTYKNYDTTDYSSAVRIVTAAGETAYKSTAGSAYASQIFQSPYNQSQPKFGIAGPVLMSQPVAMPANVRGALPTVLGTPMYTPLYSFDWFRNTSGTYLEDGVYVPTKNWWDTTNPSAMPAHPYGDDPATSQKPYPCGGIYVRGNVEVMRMGVAGAKSYYLFQLGYGQALSTPNYRRCYCIVADRTSAAPQMTIYAFTPGKDLNDAIGQFDPSYKFGGGMNLAQLESWTGWTNLSPPSNDPPLSYFSINPPVNGVGNLKVKLPAVTPSGTEPVYPFNGTIYVDLSRQDPARSSNPMETMPNVEPLTGNILALGDPGRVVGYAGGNDVVNPRLKRPLDGSVQERVATYQDTTYAGNANRLTIFAEGNIFIQNDIYLQSLAAQGYWPSNLQSNSVTLTTSKDLLGLVSGKQVVVGLYAPSVSNAAQRTQPGCTIEAAIAALGDPAYQLTTNTYDTTLMQGIGAYRGSFTTEGLMQVFASPMKEEYNVCWTSPTALWPAGGFAPANQHVYGTPLYYMYEPNTGPWTGSNQPNVNLPGVRGHLVVFGAVTERKRGIVGIGNRSYDKDFRFDKRLLTLAPPIFPTSTNVIVRDMLPESPDNLPYLVNSSATGGQADLRFMDQDDYPL